jgi:antitoxin VapB
VSLFPLVSFDQIELPEANDLLVRWGHRMGAMERPTYAETPHYAIFHGGRPVAVAMAATLVRDHVGGGLEHLTRTNTIELARLCAERRGLCRVALRLWREFVMPQLAPVAISYQDADLHNGNTYRFDGWQRASFSSSGTDQRTGRRGRRKWIWVYPPDAMKGAAS